MLLSLYRGGYSYGVKVHQCSDIPYLYHHTVSLTSHSAAAIKTTTCYILGKVFIPTVWFSLEGKEPYQSV